jgi:hypothetical protein
MDFYKQTSTKRRGRKIGGDAGKKRKTDMEFFKNLYKKKGRSKTETITKTEKNRKNQKFRSIS